MRTPIYPKRFEMCYKDKTGQALLIRPVRPSDEGRLHDLYYAMSDESLYKRFFQVRKVMPHATLQKLCSADYEKEMGVEAGYCYHCHTGRCPVGVATQDPVLRKRLDPDAAAERVYNFLHTLTIECQMMARACGKTDVHSLEPEDLAALTMEASAMAMVPLAGTQHTVGRPDMTRY